MCPTSLCTDKWERMWGQTIFNFSVICIINSLRFTTFSVCPDPWELMVCGWWENGNKKISSSNSKIYLVNWPAADWSNGDLASHKPRISMFFAWVWRIVSVRALLRIHTIVRSSLGCVWDFTRIQNTYTNFWFVFKFSARSVRQFYWQSRHIWDRFENSVLHSVDKTWSIHLTSTCQTFSNFTNSNVTEQNFSPEQQI